MNILAFDTSCDDTSVALIKVSNKKGLSFDVLSNIVSSQIEIHKKYGGVYPALAKREHQKNLIPVLKSALLLKTSMPEDFKSQVSISKQIPNPKFKIIGKILEREPKLYKKLISFLEKYQKPDIDAIAITTGPGLEPCLWVGTNFAKALAYYWNLPIIPVNHIEAHILVNFINGVKGQGLKIKSFFPAVCLVVSGGHTQLILMKNIGDYKILGETRDDAAGECFDKTARILGLGYPGGPIIASLSAKPNKGQTIIKLPRPMINTRDYDFSFSGLKTAVLYKFLKQPKKIQKNKKRVQEMCREIQQSIIDVLIKKTIKAAKDYKVKTIILGGGVAANSELRSQFKLKIKNQNLNVKFLFPEKNLSTDNALMVAITAYFHKTQKQNWEKIKVEANLRIDV